MDEEYLASFSLRGPHRSHFRSFILLTQPERGYAFRDTTFNGFSVRKV